MFIIPVTWGKRKECVWHFVVCVLEWINDGKVFNLNISFFIEVVVLLAVMVNFVKNIRNINGKSLLCCKSLKSDVFFSRKYPEARKFLNSLIFECP